MNTFAFTLLFAVLAAAATMLGGGTVVLPGPISRRPLGHLIAFGAGFMLGAAFVSMVPESLRLLPAAPFAILGGYALAHLFEHAFARHFHFGEETHTEHALRPGVSTTTLVGLALHALFDGVAISSGFLVTKALGVFIGLAVIFHKVPEGVTIASVMMAAGHSRRGAMYATGLLAAATVGGALVMHAAGELRGLGLALSSGIAVYVAATDLIPEVNQQHERTYSLSAGGGLVVYFLVDAFMHLIGIH